MIEVLLRWIIFVLCVTLLPVLVMSTIRKTKARLQNRRGPRVLQPIFDLRKLCSKGETVSDTMSGTFRLATAVGLAVMLIVAWLTPWIPLKPLAPNADLFLLFYLLILARLFTILGALDSGSSFGAFGASREATLSVLAEPAALLGFVALCIVSKNSNLNVVFSFTNIQLSASFILWLLAGLGILGAGLVELSRMPADDPTTHLELTMVHEAMVLEASGRNLALIEFAHALHLTILFGLTGQCFLRAIPSVWTAAYSVQAAAGFASLFFVAILVGTFESLAVKLQWRKIPEFLAYSMSMSLLASLIAISGGLFR